MPIVRSYVETFISIPVSKNTNLTGRINPRTLVCLGQPILTISKNRYIQTRLNLDLTKLQQLHHILGIFINLADYKSTLDQQTWQKASAMVVFLTRSTLKTFFMLCRRKRSPLEANLCCLEKTTCSRVFSFSTLHHFFVFVVVLFSIGFLIFNFKTNYYSGHLALLPACVGYIIQGPKALTKKY